MPEPVLNVLLHGEAVGTLTPLGGDRILFAFNDDYIESPRRPSLSLSFHDELGGLLLDQHPTRRRARFRDIWSAESEHLGLPAAGTKAIDRHIALLPIAQGR